MTFRPINPTVCKRCRYEDGGLWTVCKLCGWAVWEKAA